MKIRPFGAARQSADERLPQIGWWTPVQRNNVTDETRLRRKTQVRMGVQHQSQERGAGTGHSYDEWHRKRLHNKSPALARRSSRFRAADHSGLECLECFQQWCEMFSEAKSPCVVPRLHLLRSVRFVVRRLHCEPR